MSYQALARKWRPKTFKELVGQEHVVTALTNALSRNRLHHAYLLTGTRGVGKTTIARIFAKSLNCVTHGVTADPCGTCASCVDIDAGRLAESKAQGFERWLEACRSGRSDGRAATLTLGSQAVGFTVVLRQARPISIVEEPGDGGEGRRREVRIVLAARGAEFVFAPARPDVV